MAKITKMEELYVELEGKTEYSEIEAVLQSATVTLLKTYMKEEGFDCTGYHIWKKSDLVETIAVALMEDIAREHADEEEAPLALDMAEEIPAPIKATSPEVKILKREIVSMKRVQLIEMVKNYAENRAVRRAILDGIKVFRSNIEKREALGLTSEGLSRAIDSAKEEYRELRREGFSLRRKLLRVMSAEEILRACKAYIALCEEKRRRHCGK